MDEVKTKTYSGFLLLDSGFKIPFSDISEDMMDEKLVRAVEVSEWTVQSDDIIYIADGDLSVPACKIAAFSIASYEE